MNLNLIKLETEATVKRYFNNQDRLRRDQGFGVGDDAVAIVEAYIEDVIAAIPGHIDLARRARSNTKDLVPILLQLKPEKIALAGLQTLIHCIAVEDDWGDTLRAMGRALENEAFAAKLTKKDKKMAKLVEQQARQRRSRVAARQAVAKRKAADAGFKLPEWTKGRLEKAGGWLLGLVQGTLPHVFSIEGYSDNKRVSIQPEAIELAQVIVEALIERRPVFLPMTEPPIPWTRLNKGGPIDLRLKDKVAIVRSADTVIQAMWRAAMKAGTMKPAVDALNTLQAVPWKINTRVLGVLRTLAEQGAQIEGLPGLRMAVPKTPDDAQWSAMSEDEQGRYMGEKDRARKHNCAVTSDEISLKMDLATAKLYENEPRFYTPMNADFRGRVYPMCNFHFQREDRVRALFLFADGEPIGEDGIRWLKIHVASCAAVSTAAGKTDKLPLSARVDWVDQNLDRIRAVTEVPLRELWWTETEDPFLFLASCFELIAATDAGPSYVCHLPISFDGSCSGLQHLCAMTRDPTGRLVNLTTSPVPADIYAVVAERLRARLEADASQSVWSEGQEWRQEVAQKALAFGVDRKMCKRNVMTYSYSSNKHGMGGQLQVDLMHDLQTKINEGKRPGPHPFAPYHNGSKDHPGKAARHLAAHTYECIEEVLDLPAKALGFLRSIAKTCAHEAKPTCWTTPVGIPWVNRYNDGVVETVTLWMYDRGVRRRMFTNVTTDNAATIDKDKSANAISPNLVHALDAAHLLLTVNAAAGEGIALLATVHDSFGCLPSRAGRFNTIIREQFVRMYQEHDPLVEVLERAKCDLTVANHSRLPNAVQKGDLDLNGVLDATFAFA
jgi:DNA-directed RNA polymerase